MPADYTCVRACIKERTFNITKSSRLLLSFFGIPIFSPNFFSAVQTHLHLRRPTRGVVGTDSSERDPLKLFRKEKKRREEALPGRHPIPRIRDIHSGKERSAYISILAGARQI